MRLPDHTDATATEETGTTASAMPADPVQWRGRFYLPELDSIRFFAFLSVFIYHSVVRDQSFFIQSGFPRALARFLAVVPKAGNFGLDMFFALSAYLLTTLLLREKDLCSTIDVRKFYLRRILRIWPLYFFMIALALVVSHFDATEKMDLFHAFLFAVFMGRIAMAYYGPIPTFAAPLWSVSVEEQFYLVWPWVVRRSTRFIVAVSCLSLLVCFAARSFIEFGGLPAQSLFRAWFWRIDPIVYGALLAVYLTARTPRLRNWQRYLLIAVGLLFVYLGASWADDVNSLRPVAQLFFLPLADIGCIVILAACIGISDGVVGPFLRLRSLVYLGRISYGLYAYHAMVLWMMSDRATAWLQLHVGRLHHGQLWFLLSFEVAALTLIVLISLASYHLFESPILRVKERFALIPSRPGG
jgi:peptidoglycan/LPS O-acetylase OafA/YrhL